MTARPRLVRSVPFWILVIGSIAVGVKVHAGRLRHGFQRVEQG